MPGVLRGGLMVWQVLVNPVGSSLDTNANTNIGDPYDEFVQLANTTDAAIDISGIEIWDQFDGLWATIPAGTVLQPLASIYILPHFDGGTPTLPQPDDIIYSAGVFFPNIDDADRIRVRDPNNNEYLEMVFSSTSGPTTMAPEEGWSGWPSGQSLIGGVEDLGTSEVGSSFLRSASNHESVTTAAPTLTPTVTAPICFTDGTLISTEYGERPVESIRAGDYVLTLEAGLERVFWAGRRVLSHDELVQSPKMRPIKICAGSLGNGLPHRDLVVSPQHRILLSNPVVERMLGMRQTLVAAKHLLGLRGVETVLPTGGVTYLHLMLERHRVLFAEGAPAESLYFGPMARVSMTPAALDEIGRVFPDLVTGTEAMAPARTFMPRKQVHKLTERLTKNNKDALQGAF